MSVSVKTLTAATLAFGCAIAVQSSSASAQMRHGFGGMRPAMGMHPGFGMRPGFGGAGAFGRPFVYPRYGMGGAYRPYWRGGYYPYRYGYGGWGYPYRYGYYNNDYWGWGGGAVAAGLLGGLALGAITSPYYSNPYYYPSYYGYSGPYYRHVYRAAHHCFYERRRVWYHGHRVLRRVHVCY